VFIFKVIEDAVKQSSLFILFLSKDIFNCALARKEVLWAFQYNKPIITIYEEMQKADVFKEIPLFFPDGRSLIVSEVASLP